MNQVALREESGKLAHQLNTMEPEFKRALPQHIPAERFQRIAITAINRNPNLLSADRKTLLEACLLAAQDGLLPDGREAALVIFGRTVQYMPMVAGIRKKVYQSGEIQSLVARVARQNDEFEVIYGDDEKIVHKPALFEAGEMIAVYAIATYKDGSKAREVMTIAEINKIRSISRSANAGPWKDHYEEMAKKTVIRRLAKSLPLSAEVDEVIRRDDQFYNFERGPAQVTPITKPALKTIESRLDAFASDEAHESQEPATPNADAPSDPEAGAVAPAAEPPEASPAPSAVSFQTPDGAGDAELPEALRDAMKRGTAAFASNLPREVPKIYNYKTKQAEQDAFLKGWDEARRAAELDQYGATDA
jgi:recombination protein RecT